MCIDINTLQIMHQSRIDALNAVQLLFTGKFIPEMTASVVSAAITHVEHLTVGMTSSFISCSVS